MGGLVSGIFNAMCLLLLLLQGAVSDMTINYIILFCTVAGTLGTLFLPDIDQRALIDAHHEPAAINQAIRDFS